MNDTTRIRTTYERIHVEPARIRRGRDTGRAKVYRAESVLEVPGTLPAIPLEDDQTRVLVEKITPGAKVKIRHDRTLGAMLAPGAMAHWGRQQINFNGTPTPALVLHECAHLIAPRHVMHGPEWIRIYLDLVRKWLGRVWAEDLARSFINHRVNF